MEMFTNLTYSLDEYPLGGIGQLIPLHHFGSFEKNDVLDRMECMINKHPKACFHYAEKQCVHMYDQKSIDYVKCMVLKF